MEHGGFGLSQGATQDSRSDLEEAQFSALSYVTIVLAATYENVRLVVKRSKIQDSLQYVVFFRPQRSGVVLPKTGNGIKIIKVRDECP